MDYGLAAEIQQNTDVSDISNIFYKINIWFLFGYINEKCIDSDYLSIYKNLKLFVKYLSAILC